MGAPPSAAFLAAEQTVASLDRNAFLAFLEQHPSRGRANVALGLHRSESRIVAARMAAEGLTLDGTFPDRRRRRPEAYEHILDLTSPVHAYFYGLVLSDGSIRSRNGNPQVSGAVSIEINTADEALLSELSTMLPWRFRISRRTRPSPFDGAESRSSALVCHAWDLRGQLIEAGYPLQDKAAQCAPPRDEFDLRAFWRGFIDGDGSLGITALGLPFISLVTMSEAIMAGYCDLVDLVAGYRPKVQRNTRDGVYNIMLMRARAVRLVAWLYGDGSLAMPRKLKRAFDIICAAAPRARGPIASAQAIMAGELEKFWLKPKEAVNAEV